VSTLATTNIKHPSSASNNIVLDSSGGVDMDAFTVDGSAPADSVNLDSSGRLLVGTSSALNANSSIATFKASGSNLVEAKSNSLANNEFVLHYANFNDARYGWIGIFKHAGITNPCPHMYLGQEDGTNMYYWTDNSGQFRLSSTDTHVGTTSGTVVGTQTSDERLKNILGSVEYGLDTLKQIEPVRYSLKSEPETEKIGFIAQQVQPLVPQSVFDTGEQIEGEPEDAPTKLGMEYVALIPVLVNAIKELSAEVDALKAQL
jgi:hypothetical protein